MPLAASLKRPENHIRGDGEGEGRAPTAAFQDRCLKPLGHPSRGRQANGRRGRASGGRGSRWRRARWPTAPRRRVRRGLRWHVKFPARAATPADQVHLVGVEVVAPAVAHLLLIDAEACLPGPGGAHLPLLDAARAGGAGMRGERPAVAGRGQGEHAAIGFGGEQRRVRPWAGRVSRLVPPRTSSTGAMGHLDPGDVTGAHAAGRWRLLRGPLSAARWCFPTLGQPAAGRTTPTGWG